MTFEKMFDKLSSGKLSPKEAKDMIVDSKLKTIHYYAHFVETTKEPLTPPQLQELEAIVNILQVLYNSNVDSPISDSEYDILQEMLVEMGIPRLTGSIEINDDKKVSHKFTTLRGTLDKVYYLKPDEPRTNKTRKSLDEWIASVEARYYRNSGKYINLNDEKVLVQSKYDGSSCILEWDGTSAVWLSRGDTARNKASDISHIMKVFNSPFCQDGPCGVKFEAMISEEDKERINELYRNSPYHNSRQIVTATLNSNEPDFKVDYLIPIPLRIIRPGESIEQIHPHQIEKFPTMICKLSERDKIKEFAMKHKLVEYNGKHLRTDGAVLTILNPEVQRVLGRDNNINNFEVAYKFTEEAAYTKVRRVEFYVSEFGYVTPVLVTNDVILKGNTINHISLSNKERFDELKLCYGDTVKVLYDIIPYATKDDNCPVQKFGRPIEFVDKCPSCGAPLDLNVVQVQCKNPECPSKIVGRIMNYCSGVRMGNIGYQTIDILYHSGLLKHGIRSLYKLKKKASEIQDLEGFGQLKTKKIISEIEAKRKLRDYIFFGSLGIEGINVKTFQTIFTNIQLEEFLNMIKVKNFELMREKLLRFGGIGTVKATTIVDYLSNKDNRNELMKLLEEVTLYPSYSENKVNKGRIVFSGCRPSEEIEKMLIDAGYEVSSSWSNNAVLLIIPDDDYASSKVNKAKSNGTKIISLGDNPISTINNIIRGLK